MTSPQLSVLIVDDDFRVASVHKGFVERIEGFRVVGEAYTAAQALELGRSLRPDLVLLDLYLPDGDGFEVARALLEEQTPPTIMVISAATDVDAVRRSVQLGAVHYLVKPFGFAALADRLASIRAAHAHLARWPVEASQDDITKVFGLLRTAAHGPSEDDSARLAPTLRSVREAIAASGGSMSASEVAESIGISRATAQRYLSRLEQSGLITLELRYGSTGRPEHRYSVRGR